MAGVTTAFWVSAYRMRLEAAGIGVYLTRRGDPDAGAVLVKIARPDRTATLWGRAYGEDGRRVWAALAEGPEREVDEAAARQARVDPDVWLVELEDRDGRTLLDEPGLSE